MAQKDLIDVIDFSRLEALNVTPKTPADNVLKQGYRDQDELLVVSDADEQVGGSPI